jgi:Short C-terminal domain/Phospholipase_D-nuclease N-terminal
MPVSVGRGMLIWTRTCRRAADELRSTSREGGKGEGMTLAASSSSYPLLDAFWTIVEIFLWVIWIWILIYVFIDIFRSHDLSGWAKALWFLFVLLIPVIGVLVYLIVRGGSMHERSMQQAQQQNQAFRDYVRAAAQPEGGAADQLEKLASLRDRGVITAEEFDREKAKLLAA